MKWFARLAVFAGTIFFGVCVTAVVSGFRSNGLYNCVVENERPAYPEASPMAASVPTGIQVMYAGLERDGRHRDPYLKFLIYNGFDQPVMYRAKSPMHPFSELKANGKELRRVYGCGNGIETYYIPPRGAANVRVDAFDLAERPQKGAMITAGFHLRFSDADDDESILYSSQPFLLPDEFRREIIMFQD